ncbi:outer membrane protein assembly factor BamA [Flavisphingomonas formosensis]|uniref:outer membrane protein assembly factor BamA n=1 Tax=Flavisphingomonas formosensis TaxID=861534 RepID=UPI001E438DA4|nr:outer membrane protein assembly factor BamA [Sphingomonas formosensis]
MTFISVRPHGPRLASALLIGTILGGTSALAQSTTATPAAPPVAPPAAAPVAGVVKSITVSGSQRIEPDTVRSYLSFKAGDSYTRETLDQALKDLYATELFADVQIRDDGGALTILVRENPVINRIVLEGNKAVKDDKIRPEIHLAPREIFTRSKARADVQRIIELYRRQGRFAATVEPQMVQLDQNRVDIVFQITEGKKSKVRQINIIGNQKFGDGRLRQEMATKQSRPWRIFSSSDSYDPDRLAYDQQKLRQFYLTQGYADFNVVSALAELTPDKRDFIITYVVEEGERYKFGDINVDSDIRDLKPADLQPLVKMHKGDWYNAKMVEDTVDLINQTAGLLGYAFADTDPQFDRDKDTRTMAVTFKVNEAPRVYVERVDINGNTHTQDKVIRREFRLAEGDAFNSFKVKRSRDRIQSLGFFQDKLEIDQKQGSAPDRVILTTNVEEKSTGELQVSAGYSSLERFIVNLGITEHNFMGKGQEVRASADWSKYSKSVNLGFTEPYLFDKNIAIGGDVYRRDYNSFNYLNGNDRQTTYSQSTTGFQVRLGVPLTEYWSTALRYTLNYDDVSLDKGTYYTDGKCDPILAGRYLCDAIGKRLTSSVGYSLVYDNLNNRIRPSAGRRIILSQDFAGLGGDVRYIRSTINAKQYWGIGNGFIFSLSGEGGVIFGLGQSVRLTDRFFLGDPQMHGFDIRGVGPRIIRRYTDPTSTGTDKTDDALGGNKYYQGRAELEIPLGAGARELGLRPSIFADIGAVWGTKINSNDLVQNPTAYTRPILDSAGNQQCYNSSTGALSTKPTGDCPTGTTLYGQTIPAFTEQFYGNTPKPRVAIGFGVNWNSPFGPFRIDISKVLLKAKGDDTKLFSFNVGTQF